MSDGETVRLSNILIGEVWLCSGQSNMDMRMGGRYDEPVIGSLMRLLLLEILKYVCLRWMVKMDSIPLADCEGRWQEASSETVPDFTAVGYFFCMSIKFGTWCACGDYSC